MFAVFGMTPDYARAQAKKSFAAKKAKDSREHELIIAEQLNAWLQGERAVKVSPEFSTPEVAPAWMALAEKAGGLRLEVRINHPDRVVEKDGAHKVFRTWSHWVKGENYCLRVGRTTFG